MRPTDKDFESEVQTVLRDESKDKARHRGRAGGAGVVGGLSGSKARQVKEDLLRYLTRKDAKEVCV